MKVSCFTCNDLLWLMYKASTLLSFFDRGTIMNFVVVGNVWPSLNVHKFTYMTSYVILMKLTYDCFANILSQEPSNTRGMNLTTAQAFTRSIGTL